MTIVQRLLCCVFSIGTLPLSFQSYNLSSASETNLKNVKGLYFSYTSFALIM